MLALGFSLWLRKHTDLDRIEARMRAVGIDPSAPHERRKQDVRWQTLNDQCPQTCSVKTDGSLDVSEGARIRPDTASADEVVDAVLEIPATVVCDVNNSGRLYELLNTRVICGDEPAAVRSVQALCHMFWSLDTEYSYPGAVAVGVTRSILRRRQFGRTLADQRLAPELRRMADEVVQRLRKPWGFPLAPSLAKARLGGSDFLCRIGIHLPEIYDSWFGMLVLSRAGRESYFSGYLQWYEGARSAVDARSLARLARLMESPTRSSFESIFPAAFLDSRPHVMWMARWSIATSTHLRLMAADLDESPWPDDPFALTPAPLHRAERDGILIGAWSVGLDGIDQSGDPSKDVLMSLVPKNGYPKMTDPPRPSTK